MDCRTSSAAAKLPDRGARAKPTQGASAWWRRRWFKCARNSTPGVLPSLRHSLGRDGEDKSETLLVNRGSAPPSGINWTTSHIIGPLQPFATPPKSEAGGVTRPRWTSIESPIPQRKGTRCYLDIDAGQVSRRPFPEDKAHGVTWMSTLD